MPKPGNRNFHLGCIMLVQTLKEIRKLDTKKVSEIND